MKKAFSLLLVFGLVLCLLPLSAWAETYDIANGSITVTANNDGQTVTQNGNSNLETTETIITGTSNAGTTWRNSRAANTVTITAGENATANVTLQDLTIHADAYGSNNDRAAVTIQGEGDVNIELNGSNDLVSGSDHAGIEKTSSGQLTIGDDNEIAGSLSAQGGSNGAGIGGGYSLSGPWYNQTTVSDGSDIEITGGEVNAQGGSNAAGIGGGRYGDGSSITISGGEVVAQGGRNGAGIGGGNGGDGDDISISGGDINAQGGNGGAGIGGGNGGDGEGISISGGDVNAKGGSHGAGIGGGDNGGDGTDIAISGGSVTAIGGSGGAGIGGGTTIGGNILNNTGDGTNISISGGNVVAQGGSTAAGIGGGGTDTNLLSGLVGNYGASGTGSDITISGTANVSAAGGAGNSGLINTGTGSGAAIGNGGSNFSQTGSIDIDTGDLLGGTVNTFAPGTNADDMKGSDAEPSSIEHVHLEGEPQIENVISATAFKEGSYDEVVYCATCGEEISRVRRILPPTADLFTQFNMRLVQRILSARENEILDVDADIWPGFLRMVFEALAQRPDVSLNVRCLIDGQAAELEMPAGMDFLTPLGENYMMTFAEIAKLLG